MCLSASMRVRVNTKCATWVELRWVVSAQLHWQKVISGFTSSLVRLSMTKHLH